MVRIYPSPAKVWLASAMRSDLNTSQKMRFVRWDCQDEPNTCTGILFYFILSAEQRINFIKIKLLVYVSDESSSSCVHAGHPVHAVSTEAYDHYRHIVSVTRAYCALLFKNPIKCSLAGAQKTTLQKFPNAHYDHAWPPLLLLHPKINSQNSLCHFDYRGPSRSSSIRSSRVVVDGCVVGTGKKTCT